MTVLRTFFRRRSVKPTTPIPKSIIAQLAGSGTADTLELNPVCRSRNFPLFLTETAWQRPARKVRNRPLQNPGPTPKTPEYISAAEIYAIAARRVCSPEQATEIVKTSYRRNELQTDQLTFGPRMEGDLVRTKVRILIVAVGRGKVNAKEACRPGVASRVGDRAPCCLIAGCEVERGEWRTSIGLITISKVCCIWSLLSRIERDCKGREGCREAKEQCGG